MVRRLIVQLLMSVKGHLGSPGVKHWKFVFSTISQGTVGSLDRYHSWYVDGLGWEDDSYCVWVEVKGRLRSLRVKYWKYTKCSFVYKKQWISLKFGYRKLLVVVHGCIRFKTQIHFALFWEGAFVWEYMRCCSFNRKWQCFMINGPFNFWLK